MTCTNYTFDRSRFRHIDQPDCGCTCTCILITYPCTSKYNMTNYRTIRSISPSLSASPLLSLSLPHSAHPTLSWHLHEFRLIGVHAHSIHPGLVVVVHVAITWSCCREDWCMAWYTQRLLQVASYQDCRGKVLLGRQTLPCFAVRPWNPWAPLLLCRLLVAKLLLHHHPPRPRAPNPQPPHMPMVPIGRPKSAF